jgi:hypothetical protein
VISFSYLDGMPARPSATSSFRAGAADEAREAGIPFYEGFLALLSMALFTSWVMINERELGGEENAYRERKLMKVVLAHPAYLALVDG